MSDDDPLTRVHARLDDLFGSVSRIESRTIAIEEKCVPCRALVTKHEGTLYGNGQEGVLPRLKSVEAGRPDTLSIRGVVTLVGAIGTLAATIGAAMAALVR